MTAYTVKGAAIGLVFMLAPATADAAELTALISNSLKTAMEELAPQFENATGHKLQITFGSTDPLKVRIEKGEAIDVAILGEAATDDLVKQGKLVAATRAVIARSGLGVAIRKGAPRPDLSTTEAFKRMLINAKSIAYTEKGLTGIYLKGLFQRLGIANELTAKTKDTSAVAAVAKGEAEIGVTQASEILPAAGVDFAGPLPSEIQSYTILPGAIVTGAKQADAAKVLLKFLASPEAARVMKAKGLEPAD
jgi:molybdate transport system substrate-binding protein